ncbi:MAG: hypothetical protein HY675_08365 [Chloroflexi bacterium]|nr:hypothetical protein [Chloroflexota bacterium]
MANPNATAQDLRHPLPIPPDFPVRWEHPEDERLFWTREVVHYADQMSPLMLTTSLETALPGWQAAAAAYELPVVGPAGLLINTYLYTRMVPVIAPPEELAARGKRCEQKLGDAAVNLRALWEDEWLPEIKGHIGWLASFHLNGAGMLDLRDHLDEALKRYQRLYEIHFLCFFPSALALGFFEELYRDLFGGDGAFEPYRLLQGLDNKSLETGRALWQLSRRAAAEPEVRAAFECHKAAEVLATLAATPAGRTFLDELRGFLAVYGTRSDKIALDKPSWIEDPMPVIDNLEKYLLQPDQDLAGDLAALAAERERLVADARERLRSYPQPVVAQFETLLAAAQTATVLVEDHTFWLEYPALHHMRQLLLAFGGRFAAAGALAAPDDIFYLTLDELRETAAALSMPNRQGIVAGRQAEYARFRDVTPPPALGTPPPGPPPASVFTRALGKFFGTPPTPTGEVGVMRGSPGSPGITRGPAKVVRRLSEAGKLGPGDILVAQTTMPPWTPLFATAAAVVTDAGGVLCHCAIVAREYRIPAVVGVGNATTAIRDGQIVEVDGDAGTVRILPPT